MEGRTDGWMDGWTTASCWDVIQRRLNCRHVECCRCHRQKQRQRRMLPLSSIRTSQLSSFPELNCMNDVDFFLLWRIRAFVRQQSASFKSWRNSFPQPFKVLRFEDDDFSLWNFRLFCCPRFRHHHSNDLWKYILPPPPPPNFRSILRLRRRPQHGFVTVILDDR